MSVVELDGTSPEPHPDDADGADGRDVTRILDRAASGDAAATAELLPLVYQQLRQAAQNAMRRERRDHTLNATALVHEAYIRLTGGQEVSWSGRAHFYAAAAEAMR